MGDIGAEKIFKEKKKDKCPSSQQKEEIQESNLKRIQIMIAKHQKNLGKQNEL